jgi:tellurite resistance protein TehA-like permease
VPASAKNASARHLCAAFLNSAINVMGVIAMRLSALLIFALLFGTCVSAQELPESPKPQNKIFFVGVSLLAAAKITDAITTRQTLDRGGTENNFVFGVHPSPSHQAGVNAAFFAGQTAIFYFTEKSRKPVIRWLGRAYLGFVVEQHIRASVCNLPAQHHCPAFF